MRPRPRLPVVLCWHMHQPHYADALTGKYQLPWVYLHAIKDYVDMAAHLEVAPQARAVVNFAPTLLEQITDYDRQVRDFLRLGTPLRDPVLAALAGAGVPAEVDERAAWIRRFMRANRGRMIDPRPPFRRLAELADRVAETPQSALYLDHQYFTDLAVWYHLAWLGETVRRSDARVKRLVDRGSNFGAGDQRLLLELIGDLLAGVITRYRALAEQGRVELSVSPYAHPIVPLLLDFSAARDALPDAELPASPRYPGGEDRARWHLRRGIEVFESAFGRRPTGCWPSEGGVSAAMLPLLGEAGFRWTATGENVLRNSLSRAGRRIADGAKPWLHRAYRPTGSPLTCFFRDDGLSDLIGFTYADWHADDAVANLVHHLENIAAATAGVAGRIVPIILDGENAWEYYPNNGYYFLSALYRRLAEHPDLELTTFTEYLARNPQTEALGPLVAGSWVYGSFSTWIGEPAKNRGWEMLVEAKEAFDEVVQAGGLEEAKRAEAEQQLAICEGSDWFWWFGDYNPAESVSDFERLYRHQLTALYRLLGRKPPAYLAQTFTRGAGAPRQGGVMRPGQAPP